MYLAIHWYKPVQVKGNITRDAHRDATDMWIGLKYAQLDASTECWMLVLLNVTLTYVGRHENKTSHCICNKGSFQKLQDRLKVLHKFTGFKHVTCTEETHQVEDWMDTTLTTSLSNNMTDMAYTDFQISPNNALSKTLQHCYSFSYSVNSLYHTGYGSE